MNQAAPPPPTYPVNITVSPPDAQQGLRNVIGLIADLLIQDPLELDQTKFQLELSAETIEKLLESRGLEVRYNFPMPPHCDPIIGPVPVAVLNEALQYLQCELEGEGEKNWLWPEGGIEKIPARPRRQLESFLYSHCIEPDFERPDIATATEPRFTERPPVLSLTHWLYQETGLQPADLEVKKQKQATK